MTEPALHLVMHGAACALFLLLAVVLWRDARGRAAARLGALLAGGGAASAITSAPGFGDGALWLAPLLAASWSTPALFWLWARAGFGERFRLRWWHAVPCAVMAAVGWFGTYAGGRASVLAGLLAVGFAALAGVQAAATWRDDLVAGRRRLRGFVLAGTVALIGTTTVLEVGAPGLRRSSAGFEAMAMLLLAGVTSAGLMRVARPATASIAPPPIAPSVDPALLRRLEHAMTTERAYRAEGLTIGALAARLGVPDHRLRDAINRGLGQRNFSSFVNRYRIEDAKTALADPAQREVSILTIAMDAGFQSLGPFNRAFKADTGLTPTDYRRQALAE